MPWKQFGKVAVGCFMAFLGVLALAVAATLPNPSRADAEQYAVYSAYLDEGLTGESHSFGDRRGLVLIAPPSIHGGSTLVHRLRNALGEALRLRRYADPPRASLIWGLVAANLWPRMLERRFTFAADYQLLDVPEPSLPAIHERFPRSYGYMTFSAIAFNADLTEALFYTEHICGLCGGGEYVLMQKNKGKWAVVNRYTTWVS